MHIEIKSNVVLDDKSEVWTETKVGLDRSLIRARSTASGRSSMSRSRAQDRFLAVMTSSSHPEFSSQKDHLSSNIRIELAAFCSRFSETFLFLFETLCPSNPFYLAFDGTPESTSDSWTFVYLFNSYRSLSGTHSPKSISSTPLSLYSQAQWLSTTAL